MNRHILFASVALTLLSPVGIATAQDESQNTGATEGTDGQDDANTGQNARGQDAADNGGAGEGQGTGTMAMDDLSAEQFVMMAAMSDRFEIESSEVAVEKAQSDEVKAFAQQMITDHTNNTKKLMRAVEATAGDMDAPETLDAQHEAMLDRVEDASGENFDAVYMETQVMSHQQSVALFSSYAENGDNEQLREFAQEQLPVIQMHYEMVQKMEQSM
jgi:putative membrane protein